jgi:hypothetical protein
MNIDCWHDQSRSIYFTTSLIQFQCILWTSRWIKTNQCLIVWTDDILFQSQLFWLTSCTAHQDDTTSTGLIITWGSIKAWLNATATVLLGWQHSHTHLYYCCALNQQFISSFIIPILFLWQVHIQAHDSWLQIATHPPGLHLSLSWEQMASMAVNMASSHLHLKTWCILLTTNARM